MGQVVEDLTRGRITRNTEVHLDPDLRADITARDQFQAAFGQCGPSQSHLENLGIGQDDDCPPPGDLFLFFGLYRPVHDSASPWRYKSLPALHVIFGWLQVQRVIKLAVSKAPASLQRHPHEKMSNIVQNELGRMRRNNNTLYLAASKLSFIPELDGFGAFGPFSPDNFHDLRRLSKPQQTHASLWRLPSFFETLSNMGEKQPSANGSWWCPRRRGPGQEFALDTTGREAEVERWLRELFHTAPQKAFTKGAAS